MEPHKYGQFLSSNKGIELAVTQPSLGCWSTKGGNIYRTSFKGFFCLVLLFPWTRITVFLSSTVLLSHYPSAVRPGREHCLFLTVPCRHTEPPQPWGTHSERYKGVYFLPPGGVCSRADPTELLAVSTPRERGMQSLGQQNWILQPRVQECTGTSRSTPRARVCLQAQCDVWFQMHWGYLTKAALGIRLHTKWERPKPALWEANKTKDMGCCQKPGEHHFLTLSTSAGLANPQCAPLGKVQPPFTQEA